MLDVATIEQPTIQQRGRGDFEYVHDSIADLSLYEQKAVFEKIPLEALRPTGPGLDILQPEPFPGYCAIYNRATDQVCDMRPVAGKRPGKEYESYQLVPHETMLAKNNDQLWASELGPELGRVTVIDRLHDNGLKMHRTIRFDGLTSEVKSRAGHDTVAPRLDIFNSVDQEWAFQVFSGAYRDLCRNTLVFGGQKSYHQKRKHTRNLDPAAMTGKMTASLAMFAGQRELMDRWAVTRLSVDQFSDLLKATLCDKPDPDPDKPQFNRKLHDWMLGQYREEAGELGETMWAGYNALTHWSTHTESARGRTGAANHKRERSREADIRAVITSPEWASLEGVAA